MENFHCANCYAVSHLQIEVILWRCFTCRRINCNDCGRLHGSPCQHPSARDQVLRSASGGVPRHEIMRAKSMGRLPRPGDVFWEIRTQPYAKSYWDKQQAEALARSSSAAPLSRRPNSRARSSVNIPRRPTSPMQAKSLGRLRRTGDLFCVVCKQYYTKSYWNKHIITQKHKDNEAK